jgi:hypothetical protein
MSAVFQRLYRERMERAAKPHVDVYGPDCPFAKAVRLAVAEAENLEREISEEMVSTADAAEATGWNADTLQEHAKAATEGKRLAGKWRGLVVEKDGQGYRFLLSSIPDNPRVA